MIYAAGKKKSIGAVVMMQALHSQYLHESLLSLIDMILFDSSDAWRTTACCGAGTHLGI
jgi:hypothetical protein